jgi:hypothetical protein
VVSHYLPSTLTLSDNPVTLSDKVPYLSDNHVTLSDNLTYLSDNAILLSDKRSGLSDNREELSDKMSDKEKVTVRIESSLLEKAILKSGEVKISRAIRRALEEYGRDVSIPTKKSWNGPKPQRLEAEEVTPKSTFSGWRD